MINFKKIRYRLGQFDSIEDAILVRKKAEREIHDPIIMQYMDFLTTERRKEFISYLQRNES